MTPTERIEVLAARFHRRRRLDRGWAISLGQRRAREERLARRAKKIRSWMEG
jgi:hypothetical protein